MANASLGFGGTMNDKLIKKVCSMAMKAHESPEEPYLLKKCRSSSNIVIVFSFPGCWSVNDWFTGNPFGEKKIDLEQFPSLKRIATEEAATVNEAFLNRFQAILPKIQPEVEKYVKEGKQIIFTGHSSGGPIATLVTLWFLQKQLKNREPNDQHSSHCLTFGSPLLGDHTFNHAITREKWSQYFIHFVMRYDIIPRILLVPLSSIEQELIRILPFLNPRSNLMQVSSVEASSFYVTVMLNVSSLASHAACHLTGNTYNLLETFSIVIKLSPYRPFGTYVFCAGNELVVLKNPDAVLQVFFYFSRLPHEQELPVIAMRSLKDHQNYPNELQSFEKQNVINLDSLEGFLLSSDCNDAASKAMNMVLNNLGLSTGARLCLHAARVLETQKFRNQTMFDAEKLSIQTGIRMLEVYKTRCEFRKVSYYDAFKMAKGSEDWNANVERLKLASTFDQLMEMIKSNELPDGFEGMEDWINVATRFRRLVEPLDIANYYRHGRNFYSGSYMHVSRPRRYRFSQKWLEYSRRMKSEPISESCFWAEVEDLDLCLEQIGPSCHVMERISLLEKNIETWVDHELLGLDVFFKDSTFVKWWEKLPQQYRIESSFSVFISEQQKAIEEKCD